MNALRTPGDTGRAGPAPRPARSRRRTVALAAAAVASVAVIATLAAGTGRGTLATGGPTPGSGLTTGSVLSADVPANGGVSAALAKHGEALRKMFGERGLQKAPTVERPPLPGQQDVSLRPGDLRRREPGSLLRAADQRQAAALKHEITGSASLHVKLAAGLAPVSGVKTKGDLFREVRLDRAPLALASTTG